MPNIIDIPTGHVEVTKGDALLEVSAIGSCVCVCAYYSENKVGGGAHVMLPGSAPERKVPEIYGNPFCAFSKLNRDVR